MNDIIKNLFPSYIPLLEPVYHQAEHNATFLAASAADVSSLALAGVPADRIYFPVYQKASSDIELCLGKCRLIAGSLDNLITINQLSLSTQAEGLLQTVGLQVVPASYDSRICPGLRESELPAIAAKVKKLSAISINGCLVQGCLDGLHGKELGHYFRACYELTKYVTVVFPCSASYLCIGGGIAAGMKNAQEHPETLAELQKAAEIVAAQNRTAFYAKLLIS